MIDYLNCIILFIVMSFMMYLFGSSINNKSKNTAYKFVIGYIAYEFLIAVGGLPIQLLNLSYSLFVYWVFIVDIFIIVFILYRVFINKIKVFSEGIWTFIKQNYILVIVMILLMVTSLAFIEFYWHGNCQDDGFYINKMAILPYVQNPFRVSPATGFLTRGFSTYHLNVGEMEASVYSYILGINVSIYARFFLSAFQYFVLLNVFLATIEEIYSRKKWKFNKELLQYSTIIILLFAFEYHFLTGNQILSVQDSWQFNSAMYYGSSVVRTFGILIMFLPFLNKEKLSFRDMFIYGIISILLISKSSIALPMIFMCLVSYLSSHFIVESKGRKKLFSIGIIVITLLLSLFFKDNSAITNNLITTLKANLHSLLFISCLGCFFLGFLLNNKTIFKINIAIIMIFLLMFIHPLNNIFEGLSIYTFVAARTLTTFIYTFVFLGFSYASLMIFRIIRNKYILSVAYICLMIYIFSFQVKSFEVRYGPLSDSYQILNENPYFIPNSTVKLGSSLQSIYNEHGDDVNVLVQEGIKLNGYAHSLATLIHTYAPNIKVINAIHRYGVSNGNPFSKITVQELDIYSNFMSNPNYQTFEELKKLLSNYPINCIVFTGNDKTNYMEKIGFDLYDVVEDKEVKYMIYFNPDVDTDIKVDKDYGNGNYSDIFENAYISASKDNSNNVDTDFVDLIPPTNKEQDKNDIDTSEKLEDNKDDEESMQDEEVLQPSPTPSPTEEPTLTPTPTPDQNPDSSNEDNKENTNTNKIEGES